METQTTCLIVSDTQELAERLRMQLEQDGVLCYRLDRIESIWSSSISLKSLVDRADFVAAILAGDPSSNIYFELGLAIGSGKPLLVFADSLRMPADLASATVLRISALTQDSWRDFRQTFLRTLTPVRTKPRRSPRRSESSGTQRWSQLRSELRKLRDQSSEFSEHDFERLVEQAFRLGRFSISRSPSGDFGADFALASPMLNHSFGLPILIEVKNNAQAEVSQRTVDRLTQLIGEGRGGAGLIVTMRPHPKAIRLVLQRPIVIVTADEVFDWLKRSAFEDEFLLAVDTFWTRRG